MASKREGSWLRGAFALTLLVACAGCGEFGAEYRYMGARRLSDLPMDVKTVFWPEDEAVVLATWRDPSNGRSSMRIVPISGGPPCETGSLTRFAAVADDRGFRLALFDSDTAQLAFYDAGCSRVAPVLEGVEGMGLRTSGGVHRFLVQTLDNGLLAADPYAGTVARIAIGVRRIGSGVLRLAGREAIWVLSQDGLAAVDLAGKRASPLLRDVHSFAQHQDSLVGPRERVILAVQRDAGVSLLDWSAVLFEGAEPSAGDEVWSEPGACRPRIDTLPGTAACLKDCEGLGGLGGPDDINMWVSMLSPCEDRRLVLRSAATGETIVVAERVVKYRLLTTGPGGAPYVVYRTEDEDGGEQEWFSLAGQTNTRFDVAVDPDGIELIDDDDPVLRFVTSDGTYRWGLWTPNGGFDTFLDGIETIAGSGLVLHDFDGDAGTLSWCVRGRCAEVATEVPSGEFFSYETEERVNEGRPLYAFIHAFDPELGVGTLSVLDRIDAREVHVADGVASFVPVELGPARGIVYSVPHGENKGLWYAAR